MKVSLFYLPGIGNRAQVEAGMVGLRGEVYDRMLFEISEQAKLADALGYDSISFTEHHFHVEGFEVSNNPVLLDLFIGMQTSACVSASWAWCCRPTIRSASPRTSRCSIT